MYRLCQIGYPPDPDPITKAHKAAFVLAVKDRLNGLADPARGVTIAYTAMFVSATDGWSLWSARRKQSTGATTGRDDLAKAAYPFLVSHASRFARLFRCFPLAMFVLLAITASAYWDVGFSRTIVQRIEQLEKEQAALLHPDRQAAPNAVAVNEMACKDATSLAADQIQACDRLQSLDERLSGARADLRNFADAVTGDKHVSSVLYWLGWLRPVRYGFLLNGQVPPEGRPEASVASVLSLYSTYVLPAMFGLLGTLVAIMRAIQAKVRDSLLSPRDLALTLLGLSVGPMAGLAVGLYYTPTSMPAAAAPELSGAVVLSASGLGFLAGYGADAFFKFLDAMLTRVFALESGGK